MKKYLLTALVIATTATAAHAIDISECEKVGEPGLRGDWIVKCEATDELRELQSGKATAMFLSAGMEKGLGGINEMIADREHIYVNVVPNECGPDTTGYRIFKQIEKFEDGKMYASAICE